jgi:hypothetical protein
MYVFHIILKKIAIISTWNIKGLIIVKQTLFTVG